MDRVIVLAANAMVHNGADILVRRSPRTVKPEAEGSAKYFLA